MTTEKAPHGQQVNSTQCGMVSPFTSPSDFTWVKFEEEARRKRFFITWKRCPNDATHQHVEPFGTRDDTITFHRCEEHR